MWIKQKHDVIPWNDLFTYPYNTLSLGNKKLPVGNMISSPRLPCSSTNMWAKWFNPHKPSSYQGRQGCLISYELINHRSPGTNLIWIFLSAFTYEDT